MALIPYSGDVYGPGGASSPGVQRTIVTPNDSDGWAAAEFNSAYQQLADNVATLESSTFRGRNWQPTLTWPGGSFGAGPFQIEWNGNTFAAGGVSAQRWLIGGFSAGGSPVINIGYTTGTDPASQMVLGTGSGIASSSPPSSIAVNTSSAGTATPGNIALTAWTSGAFNLWRCGSGGSLTLFGSPVSGTITNLSDVKVRWVAGNLVMTYGSTSASTGAFASVTGSVIAPMPGATPSGAVATWILKSNGVTAIAIPSVSGNPSTYVTTNGTTCTVTALSFLGGSETPLDIAWSSNKQLWLMVTSSDKIYTSPDGITWTATATLTTLVGGPLSVVAAGSYWMAAVFQGSGTFPSNIIISPDAVSWYSSQMVLVPGQNAIPVLASSPTQIAVITQVPLTTTNQQLIYRFSAEAGLGVLIT